MIIRILCACNLVCVLAACQPYTPAPLDPEAHEVEWSMRGPDHPMVTEFLSELRAGRDQTGPFDPVDGLTLDEAEIVALVFNPDLRLARAEAGIAAAGAEFAGLRDDPTFSLELLRIAESVPDPWIMGAGIEFTVPLTNRLEVERRQAQAGYRAAAAQVALRSWELLGELRAVWVEWSAVNVRMERITATLAEIDSIIEVVDRAAAGGQLTQMESRLFHIERATRSAEWRALEAQSQLLALRINQQLGLRPEANINPQPSLAITTPQASGSDATARLEEASPRIAAARADFEVAEEALHLEILRQYPDLSIGPVVEDEEGQSKIGFAGGIPVPIWNRNRRAIAEAKASREAARAGFESAVELTVHEFAAAQTVLDLQRLRRESLEGTLIPLVDEQLNQANRLAQQGEINTFLQLESVTRRLEAQLSLIDAMAAEADAANRVRLLLGSPIISINFGGRAPEPEPATGESSSSTTGVRE